MQMGRVEDRHEADMTRRPLHLYLFALLLSMVACSGTHVAPASETQPVRDETPAVDAEPESALPRGVYALSGLDPTLPVSDLDDALASLGAPDVYALGETVHTSEGYAEARVRVLRYLIEHKGVRAVGFEGHWRNAEPTRAYVERCEGTLAAARAGLTFRAWMSRATSDFLRWLCEYNQAHADDKVTVFGFDVQNSAQDAGYLRSFITEAAPSEAARTKALDVCLGARFEGLNDAMLDPADGPILKLEAPLSEERHTACAEATAALGTFLSTNEASLVAATSRERFELARFAVRSIAAFDGEYFYMWSDQKKSFESRDEAMAEGGALMRTLRARGKPVALVAHNDHILRARDELDTRNYDWKSMGSWLAERWGDAYAPIGLFARNVAIDWDGSGATDLPPRKGKDDLERPLHELGVPYLFVNLADTAAYVPEKKYSLSEASTGIPARHYRALIYLESSAAFRDP